MLQHADVTIDEIAYLDLYSCFPSAVEVAAAELGLKPESDSRPLTVTGGLTFAGGPGNNYSSHAIATLVDRLRADPHATALCTALGWYLTKHAAVVLGAQPGKQGFREFDAGGDLKRPPARLARVDYTGTAIIEAYTVPYGRDRAPEAAIVTALAPDGTRALARGSDSALVRAIVEQDPLGMTAAIADGTLESLS